MPGCRRRVDPAADGCRRADHPRLHQYLAAGGGTNYGLTLQTLILMTALTFIPAALLMMTGFTRIVIVLSLLRQALGTQSAPPNQVIIGLSLFLTFFVMSPVFDRIYTEAWCRCKTTRSPCSKRWSVRPRR